MTPMPFADLEQAYEALALAIDQAGPRNEALFLAKLALVLGHRLNDLDAFKAAVATALQDIPAEPPDEAAAKSSG